MNTELLLKVKERILKAPVLFTMGLWQDQLTCGTVGCITGHAALLAQREAPCETHTLAWEQLASELFGLPVEDLEPLIYLMYWPENFELAYSKAHSDEERAKVTADRIDVFIAEHEDD